MYVQTQKKMDPHLYISCPGSFSSRNHCWSFQNKISWAGIT